MAVAKSLTGNFNEWSVPAEQLLKKLNSSPKGLSEAEVGKRLEQYGFNELAEKKKRNIVIRFLSYFVTHSSFFLYNRDAFILFQQRDKRPLNLRDGCGQRQPDLLGGI